MVGSQNKKPPTVLTTKAPLTKDSLIAIKNDSFADSSGRDILRWPGRFTGSAAVAKDWQIFVAKMMYALKN